MLDVSARQQTFNRRIRLLIADRQPIVLQGLRWVFAAQHDFELVASCSDGASCLEAIRNLAPDVALLADSLPDLTVSEILAIAKAECLSTRLVFFTESESDGDLAAAIAAGACSAISKYANPDSMLRSLRLTTKLGASPEPFQCVSPNGGEADGAKIEKMLGALTHRERQIARLVSEGKSNKESAQQLGVSLGTVKVHLHNIFQKLEITNRTVLATIALLQRPAGFGTLTLAALAFAILDDVKASEKNDIFPDDDSIAENGVEQPGFDLWKKAILRHVIVDRGETIAPTQRGSFAQVSQVTSSAASMEEPHAGEKTVLSSLGKGYGPVGSSTPDLFISPLLQAINDSQIGSPTAQQQFPPLQLASNPTTGNGGYGIFTMVAGAWIYALDHSHAAAESRGPDETLIDTSTVVTMDGTTEATTITLQGANNAGPNDVAVRSHSTQSDAIIDFTSGTDKLNLAAFGALAFLHMTTASTSVPPHTLAWIYSPASNETIVYINPTDRSLDIGDAGLLEIHLRGVVSVAESDFVYQQEAAADAALEGIDAALLAATASDDTFLTTDSVHASIEAGASESRLGTAGVWTMPADDGLRFHFGRGQISSNVSARLTSFGDNSA
jgi:VCBS repeat-containing protein